MLAQVRPSWSKQTLWCFDCMLLRLTHHTCMLAAWTWQEVDVEAADTACKAYNLRQFERYFYTPCAPTCLPTLTYLPTYHLPLL
jgi:hypothetical protein